MASSSSLPLFWELASPEEEKRISSSSQLVSSLVKQQAALASTSRTTLDQQQQQSASNGAVANSEPPLAADLITEDESEYVEGKLDRYLAAEVSYSLRRLIRGLASPREQSRVGFAVALTELLANITEVNASDVLILIIKHSTASGKVSRSEQRNLLFARLFGIQALLQSGMLLERSSSNVADAQRVTELLAGLAEKKAWLRESCGWTLVQLLDSAAKCSNKTVKAEVTSIVASQATNGDLTPEKLALLLKLSTSSSKTNLHHSSLKKGQDIFSPANLPLVAKILRNATPSEDSEDAAETSKAGANTGSHNPRVHFIWDVVLDCYFGQGSSKASASRAPFADVFRTCVDESLFAANASPERKSWGFQVFCKALPVVPAAEKPLLLTPNFMRTWINQLSGKDRLLHKAATNAVTEVISSVKSSPQAGFALVAQLLGKHGSQNFDNLTKTKTVEGLLSAMDAAGVKEYISWVVNLLATSSEDAKRKWALDQLLALVRNTAIPTNDESTEDVLLYLMACGFFSWNGTVKTGILAQKPITPLSDELQGLCRSRFFSCLTELMERTTSVVEKDGKTKRMQGVDAKGETWSSKAFGIFLRLAKDSKTFAQHTTEDNKNLIAIGMAVILRTRDEIRKTNNERHKAFEALAVASLLYTHDSPEEASGLLEPLSDLEKRLVNPDVTNGKKKASTSEADDDEEEEDLSTIELLLDYLVGFLEKPSSFLRAVAQHVFVVFVPEINEQGLDHLIDQLGLNQEPADDEDAEMAEGEEEEDDEASSETSEDSTESTSSDDDEEENAEEVDPELRNRVLQALQEGGIADESDDDDEESKDGGEDSDDDEESGVPDLTDEQMLAIDDKLADIFRERLSSRKNKKQAAEESIAFQNKILDLLALFARKQATNPLILKLVQPLFVLATEADDQAKQVSNKAATILRNSVCKVKETPTGVSVDVVEDDLEAVHSFARRTSSGEMAALANIVNVYLTRVCFPKVVSTSLGLNDVTGAAKLLAIYEETLKDFLNRNASQVKAQFLVDAFKRFPSIGWALRQPLLESCSLNASIKAYRQQQAMQMLQTVLSQVAQSGAADAVLLKFLGEVANVLFSTLSTAASTTSTAASNQVNANKLKDILKFALQAIRVTKRACHDDLTKVQDIWKPSKISDVAQAFEKKEQFKASTSLQGLFKQMLAIVEGGNSGGKKDKKRKNSVAAEEEEAETSKKGKVNGSSSKVNGTKAKKARKSVE